jgi:hypothetical protein
MRWSDIGMTTLLNPPLAVGSTVQRAGFFAKRHTLGDLSDGRELERRIGYAPGTLASGWHLLVMIGRPPGPDEFVLAGFSHFSGGRVDRLRTQRLLDVLSRNGLMASDSSSAAAPPRRAIFRSR